MIARAAFVLSAVLFSAQAAAFISAPYFPLAEGATWTYAVSNAPPETRTVVGRSAFNGAQVWVVRDQYGNETYYTNDGNGIRVHGGLFIDPVDGNEIDTYSPPFFILNRYAFVGSSSSAFGQVTAEQGGVTDILSYNSNATPLAVEAITVPAGTFSDALHVRIVNNYSGTVNGQPISFSTTIDAWLVAGIGAVREVLTDGADVTTWELQSHNAPDVFPDAFSFGSKTVQTPNFLVVSDPVTVTGFSAPVYVSIQGGEYQINGGPFGYDVGEIAPGDQIAVRVIAGQPGYSVSATVDIGGVTGAFIVVTEADTSPNAFSFTPLTGAPPGLVYTSNKIQVTGVNTDTPISIVGGEYAVNSQPFTSSPGTVCKDCGVDVRVAAAATHGTTTSATLTVGGVSAVFSVTTLVPGPGPFWQLFFASDSGDYVGDGRTKLFHFGPAHAETQFSVARNFHDGVTVRVHALDFSFWWELELDAPGSGALVPGRYKAAVRYPFNNDAPGLTFHGDGRGCNLLTGRFDVLDIAYAPGGAVERLAANFEQHCESSPRALFGEIRVNSMVPLGSNVVRRTVRDSTGDGHSDILWRNVASGENYLYPMAGTQILAAEGYLRRVADLNWSIGGMGDFDGDGFADVLWRNSSTGENYVYLMRDRSVAGEGYLRTVADQNWQVAGVGDLDGDGKDDILWRHAVTGENYVYLMDGLAIRPAEAYLRTVADAGWKIVAVADLDGDGRADILWRHAISGEIYLYPMNGTLIKASEGFLRTVADTTWEVKGAGDLDGDGKADLVWRNGASGQNYVYLMNGPAIVNEGYLRTVPDLNWQIAAVGDYDGDGKSDILWRNASTGENYLHPMDGMAVKPTEGYLRSVPPGAWTIVGK
jgi:hypothetical protein